MLVYEVYAPCSKVKLMNDVDAVIRCVNVTALGIMYEVEFWAGNDVKTACVTHGFIISDDQPKTQIGFQVSKPKQS